MADALQFEQWVPYPVGTVFGFFADPNNLPRLMPPSLAARIAKIDLVPPPQSEAAEPGAVMAGAGTRVHLTFRLLPFVPLRVPWVARITEFEFNRYFVDIQERGPLRRWRHRHEFAAEQREGRDGTIIRDIIELEFGMGPLEPLLAQMFLTPRMQSTFAHRQKAIEEILKQSR